MKRMKREVSCGARAQRWRRGRTAASIGRCLLVVALLGLAGASFSLADEEVERLLLSYQVSIDGDVTAAWGVDDVTTMDKTDLAEVTLLVPPDVAEYIEQVQSQQGNLLFDYVIAIPGATNSARASRCHCHASGTCHCHTAGG